MPVLHTAPAQETLMNPIGCGTMAAMAAAIASGQT
jgi:hypothetical protein